MAGLTNLEALDIGDNPLADLSPLAGLTKLEFLDIPGCGISDLAPLAGLTHLINLTLHNNEIADLSPLAALKNLEWIELSDNRITDLTPLGEINESGRYSGWQTTASPIWRPSQTLPKLIQVWLKSNQISDLASSGATHAARKTGHWRKQRV